MAGHGNRPLMAVLRPFYPNTKYPSVLEPGTYDEGRSGTEELEVFKTTQHHTVWKQRSYEGYKGCGSPGKKRWV